MIRKNFYLSEDQLENLKRIGEVTTAEHIRRAVDEYIERRMPTMAATSPSGKEDKNG